MSRLTRTLSRDGSCYCSSSVIVWQDVLTAGTRFRYRVTDFKRSVKSNVPLCPTVSPSVLSYQSNLQSLEHHSHVKYRAAMASEEDTMQNATSIIKRLRIHHNHSVDASVKCALWDSSCSDCSSCAAVNGGTQHHTAVAFSPGSPNFEGTDAPGARTITSRLSQFS
jgi:hypothetical protein